MTVAVATTAAETDGVSVAAGVTVAVDSLTASVAVGVVVAGTVGVTLDADDGAAAAGVVAVAIAATGGAPGRMVTACHTYCLT